MADPDTYTNIFVTHVFDLSPCVNRPEYLNILFWGQNDREAAYSMQEHFNRASKAIEDSTPPVLNDLKKMKVVLASVCGDWVRAKVSNMSIDSSGLIDVFCLDIGQVQSLPLKMLRIVPENLNHLTEYPPLASRYCLADVVVSKDSNMKEQADFHLTLMIRHKTVKAVMVGTYEGFKGARVYLNDQLVAKSLREKKCVEPSKSYDEAIKMPVPTIELPARKTHFTVNDSTAKSAPVCVARPLPNNQVHQPTQPIQEASPVKPATHCSNFVAAFLERDVVQHVTVMHAQNGPWRFTVRRNCPEVDFGLADIQQRITDLAKSRLKPLANPSRGMPCIATSTSDNSYHRGLITAFEDTQTFNVYFVDHGRFELVSQSKLSQIPSDLIAIDLMSVRVCLYQAEELAKFNGVLERFAQLALNKSFHVRVMDDSMPQSILMFDDCGRNLKEIIKATFTSPHLVLNATTPSIFLTEPKKQPVPISSRPEYARVNIKIEPPQVDANEQLFVTYVGPPGQFFGQFEKKSMEDLAAIENELQTVYFNRSDDLVLFYSDVCSHLGDFAVIRWTDDNFYRVKVLKENVNDVEVYLVDYGDAITLFRHEIWAPVAALKLFAQPPFGINCVVSGVTATEEDWKKLLDNKSILFEIGPGVDAVYPVAFKDDGLIAQLMKANHEGKAKMPEAPTPLPSIQVNDEKPLSMHTNGKLVLDDADDIGRRRSPPSGASSVRSFGSVNDFLMPPRKPKLSIGSHSGLETFELKISPRRPNPIAQAVPLFFPVMRNIEGSTKTVQVVNVDGTDSFHCHISDDQSALQEMVDHLNAAYSDEAKESMRFARVDQACVARYVDGDGAWYRGKILEIKGLEVNILFVDYGNQQRGPLSSLKVIDEEFVQLPPQAYHCCLRMARPNGDKDKFEAAVLGKNLQASFYGIGSDKKYKTKLFFKKNGALVVINEHFGAPALDLLPPPTENFTPLPISSASVEANVCWFYRADRFYLTPSDLSPYQADLDELESFYSSLAFGELIEDQPRVGLCCVVRFIDDKQYYRAKILSIKDQSAKVIFVDYGNGQDTPIKELKRITPRFMRFPQLTWECKLKDAELLPRLPNVNEHINSSLLSGDTLSALIHSPTADGIFPVEIMHPKVGDVHEYLISRKVIERAKTESSSHMMLPAQNFNFTPGQVIFTEAIVPFVVSIVEFWVQPDPSRVEQLMEGLDGLAAKPEFVCNRSFAPAIGKTCLACFSDQRWYRAVIEKLDGDTATVYYVDYGNTSTVDTRNLRALPSEFAKEAPMAYKCRLDGIESDSQVTTDEFFEYIDMFVDVHLVKTVDNALQVRLVTKDGVDIGEKLGLPAQTRELAAHISYAKSPSQFWIQLKEDEERVAMIEKKLGELNGPDGKLADEPVVGGVYGVFHPDQENWCRARVLGVGGSIGEKSVKAVFVDYGGIHEVPIDKVREMPVSLNRIPHLAIECRVKRDWSKEAVEHFSKLSPDSVFQIKLAGKEGNVQLVESIYKENEDVLETLRQMKAVEPSPGAFQDECQATNKASLVQTSARALDDTNLTPGQILSAKGSAFVITSARDIWIQLEPAAADDFSHQVLQYSGSEEFAKAPGARPTLGGQFLAQYPNDGSWYRAQVNAIEDDRVSVTYIDYGNSAVIDAELLKPLPAALSHVPPFAKKFALDGVERAIQPLPDAAQCQSVLFEKVFSVTFIKKSEGHLLVRLLDEDGVDLNQELGLPMEALVDHSVVAQDISQVLPAPIAIPANAVQVVVSHVKSNNTFWIQRRSDESLVRQINAALGMLETEVAQALPPSVAEGELCVVRHPIEQRYVRAEVKTLVDATALVHSIDTGEALTVQQSDLRCCPAMLKFIPPVAVECTFRTAIHPDQYSEEMLKAFRDATDGRVCHAVFYGPADGVQALETLYANGVDVLSMLSGHLVSSTPQSGKAITGNNFPLFANGYQRGL